MIRAGYGRSYDIGVFGSLFGHTRDAEPAGALGAGAQRAEQLRLASSRSRRDRRRRRSSQVPSNGASRCRTASARARLPRSSGRRAWTPRTSPCSVSSSKTMSIEAGYVGNQGRTCSPVTVRRSTPISRRRWVRPGRVSRISGGRSLPVRSCRLDGLGGAYGWTQGISIYLQPGAELVQLDAGPVDQAVADGYRSQPDYTLQKAEQESATTSSGIPSSRRGRPTGIARTSSTPRRVYLLPFGKGQRFGADCARRRRRVHRRLAVQLERGHDAERRAVQRDIRGLRCSIATPVRTGRI